VKFTTINMPLVRTPMIAPTKLYNSVPTLSPEEAADLVVRRSSQAGAHRHPPGHLRSGAARGDGRGSRRS
jgi:hypothetical protein